MQRDIGDLIDRWSISKLKAERIGAKESIEEHSAFAKELEMAKIEYSKKSLDLQPFCDIMLDVNSFIWQLEAGLKGGRDGLQNPTYLWDDENNEPLKQIGIMTILIRNFNHIRVKTKNAVNAVTGTGYKDIKKDHLCAN